MYLLMKAQETSTLPTNTAADVLQFCIAGAQLHEFLFTNVSHVHALEYNYGTPVLNI